LLSANAINIAQPGKKYYKFLRNAKDARTETHPFVDMEEIEDWIPANSLDFPSPMKIGYCTCRYLQNRLKTENGNHLQMTVFAINTKAFWVILLENSENLNCFYFESFPGVPIQF
jgi:hypothetical protein